MASTVLTTESNRWYGSTSWLGADGGASVLLSDGRVVLFHGDTFTNSTGDYTDRENPPIDGCVQLKGNTVTITDRTMSSLTHYAGGSWTSGIPVFDEGGTGEHVWPRYVIEKDGELIVHWQVATTSTGAAVKNVTATITNYIGVADPNNWTVAWSDFNSSTTFLPNHAGSVVDEHSRGKLTSTGSTVATFGGTNRASVSFSRANRYIYNWGTNRTVGSDHKVIVGRTSETNFDAKSWSLTEYWDGSSWDTDITQAATLFDALAEFDVAWVPAAGKYVAVYIPDITNGEIYMRTADHPEGPWSAGTKVYDAPQVLVGTPIVYNPELCPWFDNGEGNIVFLYNSSGQNHTTNDLYYPDFVSVPLADIL